MKKSFCVLVIVVFCSSLLFTSCDENLSETDTTTCWKLKSTEFWGIKPVVSGSTNEQFGSFPFNVTYTLGNVNITYSGQEHNITRTEYDQMLKLTASINFTWSQLPEILIPDTEYKVTYEAKGTVGNGMSVSIPVYYNSSYSWNPFSFRSGTGPVTSTLKTIAPDSDPTHQTIKIAVHMTSGSSYLMEWVYIYEWIP
ncbi:MAG: hypothetical protein M0Q53_17000 [Prolixibacteraceae bacterium]|jgi:hypothetical protein|nr:hypothetical protein [Prolixibacteraceae bacterium]